MIMGEYLMFYNMAPRNVVMADIMRMPKIVILITSV